jgi:hypothetical protein
MTKVRPYDTNTISLHKTMCEALGCKAKASSKVSVGVGDKGHIDLFLCEKCRPRFSPSSR